MKTSILPNLCLIQSGQVALCLYFEVRMYLYKEVGNMKTLKWYTKFKRVTLHIAINSCYEKKLR